MLQAILPGLGVIAHRAVHNIRGDLAVWQSREESDQEVVCIAIEQIHRLATRRLDFPARAILDATWQRVRGRVSAAKRERERRSENHAEEVAVEAPPSTFEEVLFRLLSDAVEDQTLTLLDAGLVYACHAVGYRIPELAVVTGRSERTLWRRRRRAEELLAARLKE